MYDTKYILVTDCDCHWYIIPLDKELDWDSWCKLNIDEGRYPAYVTRVGGTPSLVTFENFEIRE
jgi:hypothetical protein